MQKKINCKHNNKGAWCTCKKVKRSFYGLGSRICSEYNDVKCEFKEAVSPRPNIPPAPQKNDLTIPKGWYVAAAYQEFSFLLWTVVLISFDDVVNKVKKPRNYKAEEKDTFQEALKECISKINKDEN